MKKVRIIGVKIIHNPLVFFDHFLWGIFDAVSNLTLLNNMLFSEGCQFLYTNIAHNVGSLLVLILIPWSCNILKYYRPGQNVILLKSHIQTGIRILWYSLPCWSNFDTTSGWHNKLLQTCSDCWCHNQSH